MHHYYILCSEVCEVFPRNRPRYPESTFRKEKSTFYEEKLGYILL
ncbi:hypothetical protein AM1_A0240 (plasmid) [Acaryochloris marina MBIC11017]|uniref:Uncharacterized protein n=1 Tax=Acaryochloris marina (strain MBIC 11017) TaxID=329726 RepID=A8ZKP2_ACAM1|nr:hypothetical protein AM1_A0240 [Acaryochloris marina MBIC11017]